MSINKIGSDLIRPFGPKGARSSSGDSRVGDPVEETSRAPRADRVEISQEGRELAAQAGLGEARSAEIRERIDSGFYNDPQVVDQVARRVFASGDLEA